MLSLKEFDKKYTDCLISTYDQLIRVHDEIHKDYHFDLSTTEISEAILERLKAYYTTQRKIKYFLEKRYIAAASDFFVESILFYLRLYLNAKGGQLQAHSERQIAQKKNAIRPDISIWDNNKIVAIIECKTQLGWNRDNWEKQYNERNIKLTRLYPEAKSFLLVMTGLNWNGFGNHDKLNDKYFCLLNDIWPDNYVSADQIFTPIEGLFKQIAE
jgi:hypothetical protein